MFEGVKFNTGEDEFFSLSVCMVERVKGVTVGTDGRVVDTILAVKSSRINPARVLMLVCHLRLLLTNLTAIVLKLIVTQLVKNSMILFKLRIVTVFTVNAIVLCCQSVESSVQFCSVYFQDSFNGPYLSKIHFNIIVSSPKYLKWYFNFHFFQIKLRMHLSLT
jgi:hypothetical protein